MNDFLERQWPVLVIAALLIIAIAMANKLSSSNLPGKGLEYKMVDKIPIAAMDGHPQPQLGLMVDGKPAVEPYLSTLVLRNSGKISIRKEDYDAPIQLSVVNKASIVQMRYQLTPSDIDTDVTYEPLKVTIAPSMLNPGDVLILQVFTQGGMPEFDIEAHIRGIEQVYTEEGQGQRRWSELSDINYLFFLMTLFNIMLFAIILKVNIGAKYIFIRRGSGVLLYVFMCMASLYAYIDLIEDSTKAIYSSSLLLVGCSIITFLLAWLTFRFTEKKE